MFDVIPLHIKTRLDSKQAVSKEQEWFALQ